MTGWLHVMPNYLIIGFAKCGTTSLHEYLIQHPSIYPPQGKEIDYFDRLFSRGLSWYKVKFPLNFQKYFVTKFLKQPFITGEATPRYLQHPHSLQRIKQAVPESKFIVLLRNPIERAFSHYNMNLRNDYEYLSFKDAIKNEKMRLKGRYEKMSKNENYYSWNYDLFGYLEQGLYYQKLKPWFDSFPKEQFLIIQSEKFLENPSKIYHKTLQFLDLPKWEPEKYQLFKKRSYVQSKIDTKLRDDLIEYFQPHNEKLYELIGQNFDWK